MTVPLTLEADIRRLHFAEKWPVGTICAQLHVHEEVVKRVLGLLPPRRPVSPRPRLLDPYADFIRETLTAYPMLRATRLYDMLHLRGFEGSVRTVREYVEPIRPRSPKEAYLRLAPLVGEQSQVDWAHAGKVKVPGGERPLWLFLLVLAYSRALWGEFVLELSTHSLLRSLQRAAAWFGGVTRQWLFDNPKTVVAERHQNAVRFHTPLLEFSSVYCVSLRVCAVRRANEKGRVERAVRYLRDRFLAGRSLRSVEQGNRELRAFIDEVAHQRPHPTLQGRSVLECLEEERKYLLPLPKAPPCTDVVEPVPADKTGFVTFDGNVYSVPHDYAEETVTLCADDRLVRVLDGKEEVARHARCWGKHQRIEAAEHRAALESHKRRARHEGKGHERLLAVAPGIDVLFTRWLEGGRNVGFLTARTLRLLDLYQPAAFAAAVEELLLRGTSDPGALEVLCEKHRKKQERPIPLDMALPAHVPDKDVTPHSLDTYDNPQRRR
jgi:transposase